ncbi:MAG TPA: protoglobin domain-containing protein [Stellaceae bacterium]|nr:protoglobin domain-containing protein [Stellaceae bacterium]
MAQQEQDWSTTVRRSNGGVPVGLPAISEQELLRRKDFLEISEADLKRIASINDLAERYADSVIEDFYRHLLNFEETRVFFQNPATLQRVKNLQKDYFLRLTQGNYDVAYAQNRLRIGAIHEQVGLPVKSYLGMYNFYLRAVASKLVEGFPKRPADAWAAFLSLMKLTFFDMGLAIDTYVYSRERTIREQQEAIQELPTPVLPFREGMLLVPIIGLIDTQRARQLTEQLLRAIRSDRAKVVVIDITGVQSVDSKVANHIVQTVEAARLMGATVIIAGVAPEIAQTMVTLGIELTRMTTVGDLQSGIEYAERLLGYTVTRAPHKSIPTA